VERDGLEIGRCVLFYVVWYDAPPVVDVGYS
jgi:hypothetical protein